jgi:hypothetical protein
MVQRHEGAASARIAAHWPARQREAFLAFRGPGRRLVGFATALLLEYPDAGDCEADPAIAAAWNYVRGHGPLRTGERLLYHPFVMGAETYQDLATLTLVAAVATIRWLTTPALA